MLALILWAVLQLSPSPALPEIRKLIEAGRYEAALAELKKQPDSREAQLLFGAVHYQQKKYLDALPYLKSAYQADAENKEAAQMLGFSLFFLGRLNEAVPVLERVTQWVPDQVDLMYILSQSYMETAQFDKARGALARMFRVPEDSAAARLFTGTVLMRQEMEERAMAEFQAALSRDPNLPMVHFRMGEIHILKGRLQEGIAAMQKELAINPGFWMAYYRLGDAYARLQELDRAIPAVQQAIWLNPNFSGPYILMGKLQLQKGDAVVAAAMLERGIQMDPNNHQGHYLLGQAYRRLGREKDAEREWALSEKLRQQK